VRVRVALGLVELGFVFHDLVKDQNVVVTQIATALHQIDEPVSDGSMVGMNENE
jgi:hypothetical protein